MITKKQIKEALSKYRANGNFGFIIVNSDSVCYKENVSDYREAENDIIDVVSARGTYDDFTVDDIYDTIVEYSAKEGDPFYGFKIRKARTR